MCFLLPWKAPRLAVRPSRDIRPYRVAGVRLSAYACIDLIESFPFLASYRDWLHTVMQFRHADPLTFWACLPVVIGGVKCIEMRLRSKALLLPLDGIFSAFFLHGRLSGGALAPREND